VDASIAAPDPYQVAGVAKQLLSERASLDVLEPDISVVRGGRVLLAEDDKANRTLLSAALARRGYAVFTASNGEQAVRLASRDSFDAILMDLQMPGLDGFEATRRIRAMPGRGATLPIIALTALQGPRLRQRCSEAGFTAVLEKPLNLDRLSAALARWIGRAEAEESGDPPSAEVADYVADVSLAFLEEMVAVVGVDRARACVAEFVTEAVPRCRRLSELLPGWEVEAILRSCEEISGMAETCGALALGELLEEIADAASRDDRESAERLIGKLGIVTARLPRAMTACLDDIARRWPRGKAA
jgi:CheY-like chemotaxis protein